MSKVTIYHNPRCGKSRKTLDLIKASGFDPEIILYLQNPPSAAKLETLCAAMGKEPLEVMRTKEAKFKELGLSKGDARSRGDWVKIMVKEPCLIERPIVVHKNQVIIGRPPEDVLDIL